MLQLPARVRPRIKEERLVQRTIQWVSPKNQAGCVRPKHQRSLFNLVKQRQLAEADRFAVSVGLHEASQDHLAGSEEHDQITEFQLRPIWQGLTDREDCSATY